jgi:hypothetical protein
VRALLFIAPTAPVIHAYTWFAVKQLNSPLQPAWPHKRRSSNFHRPIRAGPFSVSFFLTGFHPIDYLKRQRN